MDEGLEQLKREYKSSIPHKLEQLQKEIDRYPQSAKELHFFVHKLAGSSGTYGFMEASNLCKEMATQLLKHMESGTLADPKWLKEEIQKIRTAFFL